MNKYEKKELQKIANRLKLLSKDDNSYKSLLSEISQEAKDYGFRICTEYEIAEDIAKHLQVDIKIIPKIKKWCNQIKIIESFDDFGIGAENLIALDNNEDKDTLYVYDWRKSRISLDSLAVLRLGLHLGLKFKKENKKNE